MLKTMEFEDIEELRRQEGIDDVELRLAIRGLRPGDVVLLTQVFGPASFHKASVRITSIRGHTFRGKLVDRRVAADKLGRNAGRPVVFTAAHIHSIKLRRPQP